MALSSASQLAKFGERTIISAKLTAIGAELIIPALEDDALYRISGIVFPATADGVCIWHVRGAGGGAWNQDGSDYFTQYDGGISNAALITSVLNGFPSLLGMDANNPNICNEINGSFYTGSASRWPTISCVCGYLASDGSAYVSQTIKSVRRTNMRAVDFRLASTQANGLGIGSRLIFERLG